VPNPPLNARLVSENDPDRTAAPAREASWREQLLPRLGSASASIVIHAVLILMAAMVTWAATVVNDDLLPEFKATVVSDTPVGGGGGFRFPGRARLDRPDAANAAFESDTIEDLSSLLAEDGGLRLSPMDTSASGIESVEVGDWGRSDVVGTGTSGGFGAGGFGSGLGEGSQAGGGPVGSLWGVGEGQRADSIVYVMDRSGSMADTFHLLQRELMRAIGSLDETQYFSVLWFNEGKAEEMSSRLIPANIANKRRAFEIIKRIVPSGQTEPLDAIRRGLGYNPDVMFLLSDGDFGEDNEVILRTIRLRNRKERTIINTILFVYDTMGEGERILRSIAEENGGTYKHVTQQDILGY